MTFVSDFLESAYLVMDSPIKFPFQNPTTLGRAIMQLP